MRTLLMAVLLVLAPLATTACSDSTGPESAAGTYNLTSVDGRSLPAMVVDLGTTYRLEVTSGSLTLREDGTYTSSLTFRETEEGNTTTETDTSSGTYSRIGGTITLRDPVGESVTATLNGGTLTVDANGVLLVFQR